MSIIDDLKKHPKAYFSTENGVLLCGDSQEIIKDIPAGSIDIVLSDPPYGMDYQSAWRTDRSQWKDKIHGDNEFPKWVFDIPALNAAFFFCRWDNLKEIPNPKSFIVWDKGCHSMGDLNHEFGRQWEAIAFYPKEKHRFLKRPVDIIRCPKIPPEKLIHPNEKPVSVYLPLLQSHEGIVLDPFFGSGSVGVACENLRRKWIGIEISEKYCAIAAKRIKAEADQIKMF